MRSRTSLPNSLRCAGISSRSPSNIAPSCALPLFRSCFCRSVRGYGVSDILTVQESFIALLTRYCRASASVISLRTYLAQCSPEWSLLLPLAFFPVIPAVSWLTPWPSAFLVDLFCVVLLILHGVGKLTSAYTVLSLPGAFYIFVLHMVTLVRRCDA